VFDSQQLPQSATYYFCYQLLRNVLAAYALASRSAFSSTPAGLI
jgi:hypothetical protein